MTGGVGISENLYTGALYLPSTGATASPLNFYATGTHATTWSGIWGSTPTADIKWTRIGKLVTLSGELTSATLTTAASIVNSPLLPSYLFPALSYIFPINVEDNGIFQTGRMSIDTTGSIVVSATASGLDFTAGSCGFSRWSVSYNTA